ncbi:histidine-containing phosphotransfer protein 1-like isoform X2 [Lotus japonicus]|uniref:histidine-containing phosphotransfer protein 1-like isoform X2 n=1 Tax=Lotus japonicus TaxID=34305 RepID=UPI00258A6DB5|nr:histidine-containing phosphotransfer protein 1-like isoform X2 [Lotus japonicus]XP_057457262.1 histidine-containing phosphotransfer protein 1-like isoform X2 [Lotus japonicus]
MAMPILKGLLQEYLISLLEEGVVNSQFNAILCPINNRDRARDHAVQLIETYLADVDMILSELSLHVDNSQVDLYMLATLAHEIQDKSTSIGAEHMTVACFDVIKACEERRKKRFSQTLTWLKHEFDNTKNKLSSLVQMEKRIVRLEESSQPPN